MRMTSGASPAETPRVASVVPLVPAWRVDKTFDYSVPDGMDVVAGSLVRVGFGGRSIRGVVVSVETRPTERELEPLKNVVIPGRVATPHTIGLLDWISERYVAPKGKTFARVVPPRVRVKVRERKDATGDVEPKSLLAYEGGAALVDAIEAGSAGAWMLRALPGEDRPALVAELVAAAGRAAEGAAVVAVPEVKYGSLVLDRLREVFPGFLRVDSGVPDGERSRAWLELAAGHRLAGGGRSSVLAPADPLRLLVVDDEHHRTYKEDRAPRLDARRVAIERARREGAALVLISASPSVETGASVRAGTIAPVEPDRPAAKGARPLIEFVDREPDRSISHQLHERVRDTLRDRRKVALLVPARGYARALWCAECRRSVRCPRCEAGLVFGQSKRSVRCPRCAWTDSAPTSCPTCNSTDFRYVGAGSERLTEQLTKMFPRASVIRMDPETIDDREPEDVMHGDIYVTTWIGTKPAIRPDVSLVGILDADAMIRRPDFHASENAYQAFVEMAGWAGPASDEGRLLIQTGEPAHHALQAIARADYNFFLERELRFREELGYPPFSELIKVAVSGLQRDDVAAQVAAVARAHRARVLGPIEAGFEPDKRLELLVKCSDAEALAPGLRDILARVPSSTRLRIDVDPR